MTRSLIDINVLIALIDPAHVHHDRAQSGLRHQGSTPGQPARSQKMASCESSDTPDIRILLERLRRWPSYWQNCVPCPATIKSRHLLDSTQIMDSYLLALAGAHGGQLATFDQRLVTDAVVNGVRALHVIR